MVNFSSSLLHRLPDPLTTSLSSFVELLTGKMSSAKGGDYGFDYFRRTFMELIRGHALAERVPVLNSDIRAFCDELNLAPPTAES